VKLVLNRLANLFIRVLFGLGFNDVTNAFKAYRRTTVDGCRPLLSPHFNLTVELPLKRSCAGLFVACGPGHLPARVISTCGRWKVDISLSVSTSGWRNTLAEATTSDGERSAASLSSPGWRLV
jgi:hypothetical protein